AGAIAQSEMPRDGNAGALMHEWLAFDRRAKNVEPEETPRVGWLRRPDAKGEPAKFPEQTQRAVAARPGRFLRRALLRLYRCFWFHRKSKGKHSKAERQPQMHTDFTDEEPPAMNRWRARFRTGGRNNPWHSLSSPFELGVRSPPSV